MTRAIHRIAVLRALQLGDMLCATPALRSLRAAYPQSSVTLIGLPWADEFAARFPDLIDDTLTFPGWPGIPEAGFDADRAIAFLQACQDEPFDLAVQLHGSGLYTNAFVRSMGARHSVGFSPPGMEPPGEGFTPYDSRGHESERLLKLACHLGWPDAGTQLSFPLTHADHTEAGALKSELGLRDGQYAVIHAGARDSRRRWPAENFAAVADSLAQQGLCVLLTGVEAEREQVQAVADRMARPAAIACGRTTIGGLAALIGGASVLVSNDTGVAHIAAALRVPSVVVFTYSEPERWAAPDTRLHRRFVEPTAFGSACPREDLGHRCLEDGCRPVAERGGDPVRVQDVIDAARELACGGDAHASTT